MKTVGSGSMVHGKSSDLELLNAEETVFSLAAFPNISDSTKRSKLPTPR